jgi:hypothetical protein
MAINAITQTKEKPNYPKLMISSLTKNIVLFNEEKIGTVVFLGEKNRGYYQLGDHNIDFSMDCFTDYNETITLQNQ